MRLLAEWFKLHFSDPQVVLLAVLLVLGFAVVLTMGNMLAPVLASIVVAYLLEGLVRLLTRRGVPRLVAVGIVFVVFLLFVTLILFGMVPALSRQVTQFFQQLPNIISEGQRQLMQLPGRYPDVVSPEQIQELIGHIRQEVLAFGQQVVSLSIASVVSIITILIYLILMPLLVFFFLKDKDQILSWLVQFLPDDRALAQEVWADVDRQLGNYVRGKFWEILIVGSISFAAFRALGLDYAMMLAVLVGLSVIIPFVGAAVVTIPVLLIAWFQWGWGADFLWLAATYLVIQALDGNVLVPLLFSEVVNLHPVAIMVAILVFGGLWGFWGVFFAIPLATVVHAIISAWPPPGKQRAEKRLEEQRA